MQKKYFIPLITFISVLLISFLAGYVFLFILSEKVENQNGKYYDDTGQELGICRLESRQRYFADSPEFTTIYYDSEMNQLGFCEGMGIGCTVSLKKEPNICNPESFQMPCDKRLYPTGYGATAKYKCILD